MSQFTHLGVDIYPQGDIPKEALKVPVKLNRVQRAVKEFFEQHPNYIYYLKFLDRISLYLIVFGMAVNIFIAIYILYKAAVMSFTLQSQYGFQAMIITLLTLFTFGLITAIVNISKSAYKLLSQKTMSNKERSRRVWAIQWRGFTFWLYSLFCGIVLISIPALLAPSDFDIQPASAKAARFIVLFAMLLIEKILETYIVAKFD